MRAFWYNSERRGRFHLHNLAIHKFFAHAVNLYRYSVANDCTRYKDDATIFFCNTVVVWQGNIDDVN